MLRTMLCVLLVRANRAVTTDSLVDALWADHPPPGARKTVQIYMHRLRSALGDPARTQATPGGYRLECTHDELDAELFMRLVAQAREAEKQDQAGAAELYGRALDLWRGPAYDGLADAGPINQEAGRLEAERLQAITESMGIGLALGRHEELIPELAKLCEQHSFHEDLRAAHMLALYRAGRQAEALEVYRKTRELLREELGLEPGPALRRRHESILRSDPELDLVSEGSRHAVVPRELPPSTHGFTGRSAQLSALDRMLLRGAADEVPIGLITGSGGVGKTALALKWAHRNADRYPDGQLFLDLRGYATGPRMRPIEALTALLRSVGVPPRQIPVDVGEAVALLRSELAGRRMLLVLDNARLVEDVRHLLPGTAGCAVIVTSRDRLSGLVAREGAMRVSLDVLTPNEAHTLITNLAADQSDAVPALAKTCAYLPLAIRIAVAHLMDHPYQSMSELVALLRSQGRLETLAVLGDDTTAVRRTFEVSYQAVPADAQLVFRRLGLVPLPDYTPLSVAALAGVSEADAMRLLTRLADAHLVQQTASDRFTLHDLLREYAGERCHDEDKESARDAAAERLANTYMRHVDAAAVLLYPYTVRLPSNADSSQPLEFDDSKVALAWLDAEYVNVTALIQQVSRTGYSQAAWLLADGIRGYFDFRRHTAHWFAACRAGLSAARMAGDHQAQAAMFLALGHAYGAKGQLESAVKNFYRSMSFARTCDWTAGLAIGLGNAGAAHGLLGMPDAAASWLNQALELWNELGEPISKAKALNNLATAYRHLGKLQDSLRCGVEGTTYKSVHGTANMTGLPSMGLAQYLLGDYAAGIATLERAMPLLRSSGNRPFEAYAWCYRSQALLHLHRLAEAASSATEGLRIAREISLLDAVSVCLIIISQYLHITNDDQAARRILEEAVDTASRAATNTELAQALVVLARVQFALGEEEAAQSIQRCLEIATKGQLRLIHAEALTVLAQIHQDDPEHATSLAREALAIHMDTGYAYGQAEAHTVLAQLHPDPATAEHHATAAAGIYERTGTKPPRSLITRPLHVAK